MSIENITQKILSEAANVTEVSVKNAEGRGLEIINEARKQAEEFIAEATNQLNIEAAVQIQRKISAAQLQARKMLLSAKQEAVKRSFDAALEKLKEMPEEKYIKFLDYEINKVPNCAGELFLNDKDRKNIGEKLVEHVNEKLIDSKIELSKSTIQTSGGFIIKNGNIEVNSTFETILASVKDSLTIEIANVLFK